MEGNYGEAIEWDCQLFDENVLNKSFPKPSIAQRREEKCGFNASGMSTPAMSPPPDRQTFLTIPPGLAPTALLDSPVMLSNPQAPQSPTTGSFQQFPNSMSSTPPHVVINANCPIKTNNVIDHHLHPPLFPSSSNTQSQITSRYHEEMQITSRYHEEMQITSRYHELGTFNSDIKNEENMSGIINFTNTSKQENCHRAISNSIGPDDGYTWRKYGQKTVKGSEFPRSYYKCTGQNCAVKKKVERSPNGEITEIIYNGEHNHQKSQLIRRAITSSKSCDLTEILNHPNINMNLFETTREPCSPLVSCEDEDEDEDEVRAIEGIISVDDNEFEQRRRRDYYYPAEMNLSPRSTKEPRVIVQIESEIDILDDGYRWRKYGQKVVKGNPNPRSYYKCTSPGCPVRKQIERAPDDIKSVITTYEGKHNHQVPSINKTNGVAATATVGNQTSPLISNDKSSILPFSESHNVSNLETQVQDFNFQLETKPFGYTRPNFVENQLSKLRCGPLYDLRLPPNLLSYNSFLFNSTNVSNSLPFNLQMPDFSLPNRIPPLDEFHFNDLQ